MRSRRRLDRRNSSLSSGPPAADCLIDYGNPRPHDRFGQVGFVNLGSDEVDPQARARDRGAAEPCKRIHGDSNPRDAVETKTLFREPGRKGRGGRPVRVPPLDCPVRNEPGVPAAANAFRRPTPSCDVRLVLIGNAERKTIERGRTLWREMKNEFVAIVQETIAVDWLVVTDGQIFREPGGSTGRFPVDGDGFDPVNDVLQLEMLSDGLRDVERGPRVLRLGADVQEERTIGC